MDGMLPVARIRDLRDLIDETREALLCGADPARQVADGFSRLVDADAGGLVFGPRVTRVGTNLLRLVTFGFSESEVSEAERLYLEQRGNGIDLAAATLTRSLERGVATVARRRDLVEDAAWYCSDFVNDYRRPWRLDDSIYGGFIGDDGRLVGFACFRAWGGRRFTDDERVLAHLYWDECVAAIAERHTPPLSRRRRETLRLLLAGHSARAIASKLNLAVATTNGDIKAIYRAMGVRSRGELIAGKLPGRRARSA